MTVTVIPNISARARPVLFSSERLNQVGREVDAFERQGCRAMMMQLLVISLNDLLSPDAAIRNDAKFWFDPIKGKNRKISFEDCVRHMGCISRFESICEIVFSQDADRIKALANTIDSHIPKPDGNGADYADSMSLEKSGIENLQLAFR